MKRKILIHSFVFAFIIFPLCIHAQGGDVDPRGISIQNPFKGGNTLPELLTTLLNNVVMPLAAVFVTVWIIYAGFTYVMAQGNPKKVEEAHQRLLWSLVGAGILLGAAAISKVVQNTVSQFLH